MIPQYRIEQYLNAINAAYLGESPLPEYPAEPVWRIERFLAAILSAVKGDSPVMACPDPVWHIEEFARAIYDALVGASPAWPCPTATNNIEAILHAIYKVVADGTETDGIATSWDIERWLLDSYDAAKQGGGGTQTTVSGNLPLVLQNAIEHAIKSLTRYGLCTQDGTPTPSAPVDIVCNNGALRFGALGVNLLNPVGIVIGQNYTPEGNTSSSQNNWRTGFIPIEGGKTYAFWGRKKSDNTMSAFNRINWFDADGNNILPRPDYNSYAVTVGIAPSNAAFVGLSCSCYNSSAAITQETLDEFNWMLAETDIEIPYEPFVGGIVADGTPEVLTVRQNLYDASARTDGFYLASGGNVSPPTAHSSYSGAIPVEIGKSYTFTGVSSMAGSNNKRIVAYSSDGNPASSLRVGNAVSVAVTGIGVPYSVTIDLSDAQYANARYIRFSFNTEDTDVACIEVGSGQTASVPMLLSVGDTKDEAELISGIKTGKVGIKVLDGTETFSKSSAYGKAFLLNAAYAAWGADKTKAVLCTHFLGLPQKSSAQDDNTCFFNSTGHFYFRVTDNSDTDAFKAWLAEQYAAGTPVIVFFVLAESTTEQTTAQHLSTHEGTNIVDSVANVSPLAAEVKYMKGGNEA